MGERNLCFDLSALMSLHRFGDLYAQAIGQIQSDIVTFQVLREAKDSIGPHWYGMRCLVTTKASGVSFYFHTGLIFLPATKVGLMVEVDRKNNLAVYDALVSQLWDTVLFTVNRDEEEYLKLFMPDETFDRLNEEDAARQKAMLSDYMKACAEAAAQVIESRSFRVKTEDMLRAYDLGRAFHRVVTESAGSGYTVQINESDPDNFGQYASGYRYWLESASGDAKMYAYFGAIYSYKKRPAGIFAEIDWFSNQEIFHKVKQAFRPDPRFRYSSREEKFIKLFMPEETVVALNGKSYPDQIEILKDFFEACNQALVTAAEKENEGESL